MILKFLRELFKPVIDWIGSFFPSQEEKVEKSWTRISEKLDKLKDKREKNLPITYENVGVHKKIIRKVEGLRKEIIGYRSSRLKFAFKRIDSTFKECVAKTKEQIAFAESQAPRSYRK